MGNNIDVYLSEQAEIFNKVWKDPEFKISHKKLKSIQKLILKEYKFLQSIHESMLVCHNGLKDCPIILQNKKFTTMTGYSEEDILGRNCRFLQGPNSDKEVVLKMRECLLQGIPCHVELLNYRKDGGCFWNDFCVLPVHEKANKNKEVLYFIAIQKDVIIFPTEESALESGRVQKITCGDEVPPIESLAVTIGYSVPNWDLLKKIKEDCFLHNSENALPYCFNVREFIEWFEKSYRLDKEIAFDNLKSLKESEMVFFKTVSPDLENLDTLIFVEDKQFLNFENKKEDHDFIVKTLKSGDFLLLRSVLEMFKSNNDMEELKKFLNILGEEGLKSFLAKLCEERLKTTKSENTLYRDDQLDTWLIKTIFTMNGEEYLKVIMEKSLEKLLLLPDAFEVRQDKILHVFFLRSNAANIVFLCKEMLENIEKYLNMLPDIYCKIMDVLTRECVKVFPQSKNKPFASLFFLRYFNPSFIHHCASTQNEKVQRASLVISKVLQCLVNQVKLEKNEDDTTEETSEEEELENIQITLFNEFFEEYSNKNYLGKVVDIFTNIQLFHEAKIKSEYRVNVEKNTPRSRSTSNLFEETKTIRVNLDILKFKNKSEEYIRKMKSSSKKKKSSAYESSVIVKKSPFRGFKSKRKISEEGWSTEESSLDMNDINNYIPFFIYKNSCSILKTLETVYDNRSDEEEFKEVAFLLKRLERLHSSSPLINSFYNSDQYFF